MNTKDTYKGLLLKSIEQGTETIETLTQKKLNKEAKYANDPEGLAASETYKGLCEVIVSLQTQTPA